MLKSKNLFVLFSSIVLLVAGLIVFNNFKGNDYAEEVHIHAGFQVYKDEELVDFSGNKYMNFTPCGEHSGDDIPEEQRPAFEQIEKAHLHDNNGDVVHVHRNDALWKDLFINLGYELPENVEIYHNGEPATNVLNKPIEQSESIIILIDTEVTDEILENAVTVDRIVEIGEQSELCGTT